MVRMWLGDSKSLRRSAVFGTITAGWLCLALLPIGGGPAQASGAPSVAAGQAGAYTSVLGVGLGLSGLALTTYSGQSQAAYNQSEATASSASVNLGGLGALGANTSVCGTVPLPANEQPQALTADSADGASSKTTGGNLPGGLPGTESVSVSPLPEIAMATTSPVSASVAGLLSITGTSSAAVRYVADTEQEAFSSVTDNLVLAGGLVEVSGMRWTASTISGATSAATANFTFGTVTTKVLGIPVQLPGSDSTATLVNLINLALSPVGISLTLPTSTDDTSGGSANVGPLTITFRGSSLESKVVSPLAAGLTDLDRALAGYSSNGTDCAQIQNLIGNLANPSETVANLVAAIAEGAGSGSVYLGGAGTSTEPAPDFTDPFGNGSPTAGEVPPTPGTTPATTRVGSTPSGPPVMSPGSAAAATTPTGSSISSAPATMGSPAASPSVATISASSGPTTTPASRTELTSSVFCATTSPSGRPACWKGLGSLVGGTVVVLAGGMLAADLWRNQRANRKRRVRKVYL
jgi:hypothetical protein